MTPSTGPRKIVLVERRTRFVRLPRADAKFLDANFSHVIDTALTFDPGVYGLTPRRFVGFLHTPNVRVTIRPKVSWPTIAMLLGVRPSPAADAHAALETTLLNSLAREMASALGDVARGGLVQGYSTTEHQSAFLRGRLRTAEQLRDAARNRTANLFHVEESVFDLDTPWNAIPRAVAGDLADVPGLDPVVRAELNSAIKPWLGLPTRAVTDADYEAALREPTAAAYAPLIGLCRLVTASQRAVGVESGQGFLLDLGRAFERYVAAGLLNHFATRPGWSFDAQPRWEVAVRGRYPHVFRPDIVIRRDGRPVCVLDTKWKRAADGPHITDIHQIIAYASVTGAPHVGLIYPTRRFRSETAFVGEGGVRLNRFGVSVVGTAAECERSLARLAMVVRSVSPTA